MITSVQNNQVKNIIKLNQKAKARKEQGLFIAEGRKMFLEAPLSWIEKVYVTESMTADKTVMEKAGKVSWETVADSVFRMMSDTQTPQGVMTVLRKPSYQQEDILKKEAPLIVVLEDLQDPGNAGTIFRTAEGGWRGWYFSYQNLCGYYQSKSNPGNHGICLQNAFFIRGRRGIIKTKTSGQRNPLFCSTFTGQKFLRSGIL